MQVFADMHDLSSFEQGLPEMTSNILSDVLAWLLTQ